METYEEFEALLRPFVISALDGGQLLALASYLAGKEPLPRYALYCRLSGPQPTWTLWRRKESSLYPSQYYN
jgi:hypothetical protein